MRESGEHIHSAIDREPGENVCRTLLATTCVATWLDPRVLVIHYQGRREGTSTAESANDAYSPAVCLRRGWRYWNPRSGQT